VTTLLYAAVGGHVGGVLVLDGLVVLVAWLAEGRAIDIGLVADETAELLEGWEVRNEG